MTAWAVGVLLGLALLAAAAGYVVHRAQRDGRHTPRGQARHRHPSAARARRRDRPERGRVRWGDELTPRGEK